MRKRHVLPAVVAAGLALSIPAQADDVEAALERMLQSQGEVLDVLEEIRDRESLETQRHALTAALEQARVDTDAVADHAESYATSTAVQAAFRSRFIAYNQRKRAVNAGVLDRLDAPTLDRLDAIFDAAD